MKISDKELSELNDLSLNATMFKLQAEKLIAEAKFADATYKNTVLSLYLKYQMPATAQLNDKTGEFTVVEVKNVSEDNLDCTYSRNDE